MSDSSPWQSPSGGPAVPPPSGAVPPPPPGPPPPPPPGWAGQPGGYVPPPRPGLIPLAPMGLGVILGASFRVLRRNPRPVVGVSLVIHAIVALINIAVTALLTVGALGRYFDALQSVSSSGEITKSSAIAAGSSLLVASATGFIGTLFTYAGDTILQGIITTEVARGTVGEKLSLSGLWARTRGRIPALLAWGGLVILVTLLVLALLAGLVAILFAVGGTGGAVAGGILGVVFVLAAIVAGIWLTTKLSLVPSALVIERLTLRRAIVRSWRLVRGYFWRTFGIEILVALIVGAAASVIEVPVTLIVEVGTLLSSPTGLAATSANLGSVFGVSQVVTEITAALVTTITAIVSTSATSLIYIDLRIRKEGLDLALMRFVDARAAGSTGLADPYLTAESVEKQPSASGPESAA